MKIKGTQTKSVDIEVDPWDILTAAQRIIREKNDLRESDFLSRDKKHIMYDDPDHRHGSIQEYVRREATEDDIDAIAALNFLEATKRRG